MPHVAWTCFSWSSGPLESLQPLDLSPPSPSPRLCGSAKVFEKHQIGRKKHKEEKGRLFWMTKSYSEWAKSVFHSQIDTESYLWWIFSRQLFLFIYSLYVIDICRYVIALISCRSYRLPCRNAKVSCQVTSKDAFGGWTWAKRLWCRVDVRFLRSFFAKETRSTRQQKLMHLIHDMNWHNITL